MFSKPQQPQTATPTPTNGAAGETSAPAAGAARKTASLISGDLKLEGSITGGSEVQIDGSITGDVRVEKVLVGEGGHVEGGVFAESVEVRGRISGAITAKQVRLYGAAHVEGDITHEQLSIEPGAFFQGRSLRLQRSAPQPQITPTARPTPPRPEDLVEQRAAGTA
jgi:cytoskeletal protein CcmA (bactofilin family)